MDILAALKDQEKKLQQQLTAIQGAIRALNGKVCGSPGGSGLTYAFTRRRSMSAAARQKISKAAKERWAKYRATKRK
jgi:hypothetical protein